MNADSFAAVAVLTVLVAAPIALLAGLALHVLHRIEAGDGDPPTARSRLGPDPRKPAPGRAPFNPEE